LSTDDEIDLHVPPTDVTSLYSRTARLRHALLGFGSFFTAAYHDDPLPHLRDLASDLLSADHLDIVVPAPLRPPPYQPGRLCSPILIGRRPVGAIEATRRVAFDEDERILADTIGQIIGAVLERSTLESQYQQVRTQVQANTETLDLLLEFSRQMSLEAPDPIRLGLQLAVQVPRMVGGERASLLILPLEQSSDPQLLLSTGVIATAERALSVQQQGLAGMVLRDRQPLIIDETHTDTRWLSLSSQETGQPTRCAMAVPLVWGSRLLGALTVTTTQTHLFDTPQLHLLELIACHVALALHYTNLEAQLRKMQQLLAESTTAIAEALTLARQSLAEGDSATLNSALDQIAALNNRLQQQIALLPAKEA
jgi:GAF domain-containing protein